MRIVCPACAAAYQVPDDRLKPGRVVRCARCETDWVPLAEPGANEPPPEKTPTSQIEDELPPPEPNPVAHEPDPPSSTDADAEARHAVSRANSAVALRIAWGLSVAAIIGALAVSITARESVMRAWPPSMRAYAMLGLVQPSSSNQRSK